MMLGCNEEYLGNFEEETKPWRYICTGSLHRRGIGEGSVSAPQPYLHESRHTHAMKRARGSGGRFLNTKLLQQQQFQPSISTGLGNVLGSNLHSENGFIGSSATPTSSDITSVSTSGGMLLGHQDHLGFLSTDFHSHVRGSTQGGGGMIGDDSQARISIMQ